MTKYRVREGYRHGPRNQYGPGDILELTEDEARGLLDKLERVEDTPAPADAPPAEKETIIITATPPVEYEADDLTAITGIGNTTAETLNGLGVHTYADLMAAIDEAPQMLKDAIRATNDERLAQWRADAADRLEADHG